VTILSLKVVFQDPTFSLQLLRAMGQTYYGGADVGECLSTAYRIKEGDFESWHTEWLKTADRVRNYAEESLSSGNKISARDGFLRASNYYRAAEFLLVDPEDPRILDTWGKSKACFKKATDLFDTPVELVQILYGETTLPGHFYSVDTSKKPRSTLIVHGGFDSTLEELYFSAAAPALQRGYNCLTFEGPGQGGVIRKDKIPFRFDWEKVVTPVVEYAFAREEVDPKHIALMGISFGGYLAARACAFESRISACILYNGVYDGKQSLETSFPKSLKKAYDEGNEDFVNKTLEGLMESDPNLKFNIKHGMWTTGSLSPFELVKKSSSFTMDGIAQNIHCPTLVLDAEKDDSFPGQPQKVYDALQCPKKYILFTEAEGAEEHCQCGAASLCNQRIFDWLSQTFE
jgi:pimeloyl-ACP methyl ester carboxylesterase